MCLDLVSIFHFVKERQNICLHFLGLYRSYEICSQTKLKHWNMYYLWDLLQLSWLVYPLKTCHPCAAEWQHGGERGLPVQLPWLPAAGGELLELGRGLAPLPLLRPSAQLRHHRRHQVQPLLPTRIKKYRQTPIFRHPFSRKQCFSLKYVLVAPLRIFGGLSKIGIYVILK